MKKQIILSSLLALTMQANEQMVITALELAAELPEMSQQDKAKILRQQQIDSLTKKNQAQRIQGAYRRHKEKELDKKIAQDAHLLSGSNAINANELLDREAILLARAQEMIDFQNRWYDPNYDMNI